MIVYLTISGKDFVELVKHCHACQTKQTKPHRFLFPVRDPAVGQFYHHLQNRVFTLIDMKVLHVIAIGRRFKNAGIRRKRDAGTAWRLLRKY